MGNSLKGFFMLKLAENIINLLAITKLMEFRRKLFDFFSQIMYYIYSIYIRQSTKKRV